MPEMLASERENTLGGHLQSSKHARFCSYPQNTNRRTGKLSTIECAYCSNKWSYINFAFQACKYTSITRIQTTFRVYCIFYFICMFSSKYCTSNRLPGIASRQAKHPIAESPPASYATSDPTNLGVPRSFMTSIHVEVIQAGWAFVRIFSNIFSNYSFLSFFSVQIAQLPYLDLINHVGTV